MLSNWREWITDRFKLDVLRRNILDRLVAKTPWYFEDGATLLFLLAVLVVTGLTMTLTYSPTPDTAYASVQYITNEQRMGWFVRGLHYWSAGLFMVMIFVHLFRQILLGGYKPPREGTWLVGVMLLIAVFIMAFVGYLLRWDERAINAIFVVLHMFSRIPVIGEDLVVFIQGGEELGESTLLRLYAVHVLFVPLLLLGLAGYHLYLVIQHGVMSRIEQELPVESAEAQKKLYKEEAESEERGEMFYPDTVEESGLMAFFIFLIAAGLAVLHGPPDLFPEASLTTPSRPQAEWWYWWYDALIAVVPPPVAPILVVVFPILLIGVLVSLPFLDRGPNRGFRKRPFAVGAVAVCVVGLVTLSVLRAQAPWEGGPQEELPPIPDGIELSDRAKEGYRLFGEYGCTSCHPVGGIGPKIGVDLAERERRLSQEEIRKTILNPSILLQDDVPMPSYEGRMTEEELDRLVAFVMNLQAGQLEP